MIFCLKYLNILPSIELTESLKTEKELTADLQDKLSKAITREVYMQIIDELKGAKGRVNFIP